MTLAKTYALPGRESQDMGSTGIRHIYKDHKIPPLALLHVFRTRTLDQVGWKDLIRKRRKKALSGITNGEERLDWNGLRGIDGLWVYPDGGLHMELYC